MISKDDQIMSKPSPPPSRRRYECGEGDSKDFIMTFIFVPATIISISLFILCVFGLLIS